MFYHDITKFHKILNVHSTVISIFIIRVKSYIKSFNYIQLKKIIRITTMFERDKEKDTVMNH